MKDLLWGATLHPRIRDNKSGCAFRFITYYDYDYAVQDNLTGVQIHYSWFLEWVGAPEYARLLGCVSNKWIRSLTWLQTIDFACQLQRDACLMTSNLSVLDQYALSLNGTASDILELVIGCHNFLSAAMDTTAPVPIVCRASAHMEAMGLWRPSRGPGGPALDFVCLGGRCCGERMGYHDVCRAFRCSSCAEQVRELVLTGILMRIIEEEGRFLFFKVDSFF